MNHGASARYRRLWWVAIALSFALCLSFVPVSHIQARSPLQESSSLSASAQRIAEAINQARAAAGLPPLTVQPLLNQAAQVHSDDIAINRNYSHWGTDGTLVRDRVARTGYAANPWVSENWVSSSSPEGAMNWWMNDWIHRVNILNGNWREVGIGVSQRGGELIFVTVFSAGTSGRTEAVVAAAAAAPAVAPSAAPAAPIAPATVPPEGMNYTIRPGDTLLGVAARYGMDWKKLASANGLSETSVLQIGQAIRIPGSKSPEAIGATAQVLAEAKISLQPVSMNGQIGGIGGPVGTGGRFITLANSWLLGDVVADDVVHPGSSQRITYTVEAGDTLFGIAARFNMTWQDLASLNGFGEHDVLQIGQVMWIPIQDKNPVPIPAQPMQLTQSAVPMATEGEYYTISEGDTIFAIALRNNLDWQEVLRLNGLDESDLLQPGQSIRLR